MNTAVPTIEPRHAAGQRCASGLFRGSTLAAALLVLLLLGGVAVSLAIGRVAGVRALQARAS